jgi:preprotein translocase subunit SecG
MQAVILSIHLILAFALIIVVLLQRSEGGGLGMGGGGGVMTSRGAATALSKVTWVLGGAFVATSLALTIIAARDSRSGSVIDGIDTSAPITAPVAPDLGGDLLPTLPGAATDTGDGPATPPVPADTPASSGAAPEPAPPATPASPVVPPAPATDAPAAPPPTQ